MFVHFMWIFVYMSTHSIYCVYIHQENPYIISSCKSVYISTAKKHFWLDAKTAFRYPVIVHGNNNKVEPLAFNFFLFILNCNIVNPP